MTGKVILMLLSRHRKQPRMETVYLGIPRNEAVVCDTCNTITRAVNARCGLCSSEAVVWVSSVVPGRPVPPDPPAARVHPLRSKDVQDHGFMLFPNILKLAFRTILPTTQPNRYSDHDWPAWTARQHAIEEMLSIPTIIRERASLSKQPAA